MEEILALEKEEPIERAIGAEGVPFPAVSYIPNGLYFNTKCAPFFKCSRILVSTAGQYIVFRGTELSTGYKITIASAGMGFTIHPKKLFTQRGFIPSQICKTPLMSIKGGGYAIKAY